MANEWASDNTFSLFCHPANILNPRLWRMLWDIMHFNTCAGRFIAEYEAFSTAKEITIGGYLRQHGYSDAFRDNYLMPLTASIWSTTPETVYYTVLATLYAQSSLTTAISETILVDYRGREYVNKIIGSLPSGSWRPSMPVASISPRLVNGRYKVTVVTKPGTHEDYDNVILATHSDTSPNILPSGGQVTEEERTMLGGFAWTKKQAVSHSDTSVMPRNRSAWNYCTSSKPPGDKTVTVTCAYPEILEIHADMIQLTASMNVLQSINIGKYGSIFSTLNPRHDLKEDRVQARIAYDHPTFDAGALRSQKAL